MPPRSIDELRQEFTAAYIKRQRERDGVKELRKLYPELHEQILAINQSIEACTRDREMMRSHLKTKKRSGSRKTVPNKMARCNVLTQQIRALRSEQDALLALYGSDLPSAEKAFILSRHALLKAIYHEELCDASAQAKKRQLMLTADIKAPMYRVWYCEYPRGEVHMFYGGGLAPTRRNVSPDGDGHGHSVLKLKNGELTNDFHRSPIWV